MFAPTMALLTRSFRLDARSGRAHLFRLGFAGLVLLSVLFAHLTSEMFGAPGLRMLQPIAWFNYVLITLASIGFFATAISEEKDEETLGLLKMAGISPAALLLGKSTTRVVSVLLILAVQFPFVLLASTLGGVTLYQIFALFLALIAYMICMANLGLACSVFCATSRRAESLMILLIALFQIALPLALALLRGVLGAAAGAESAWLSDALRRITDAMTATSVTSRISTILSTGFAESALSTQVFVHLGAAVGLFGWSWAIFERYTRESHGFKPLEATLVEPFRRKTRAAKRRVWRRALMWKDFHFVAGGRTLLVVRYVIYGAMALFFSGFFFSMFPFFGVSSVSRESVGTSLMRIMFVVAVVELSFFTARVFRDEVRGHTLPLLLMLPASTSRIAWSKVSAAVPGMAPTLTYFVLGALIYPEGLAKFIVESVLSPYSWYAAVWYLAFLHLVAYLSLVVKWGALPLAIFMMYFFHSCLVMPVFFFMFSAFARGPGGPNSMWLPFLGLTGIGAIVVVALHLGIGKRLEMHASQ